MNISTKELDRIIDEILSLGTEKSKKREPGKPGRRKKERSPVWALRFSNPEGNRTFALISMCIKEDPDQSMHQLALRLSAYKSRPPAECLEVITLLREKGQLGYYDDATLMFRTWDI